ncbi:hypothetical protein AB0K00_46165 [Dactylosporangium sp. NPDC049525]|uniref:hypothetical protein n=1 Tax=Dactylosporangium sp. NPDC049525 TaxID=3154730 RepID=UPI00343A5CD8
MDLDVRVSAPSRGRKPFCTNQISARSRQTHPDRANVPLSTARAAAAQTLVIRRRRSAGFSNQFEVHPYFTRRDVQAFGTGRSILTQVWWPIGGITFYRDSTHSKALQDKVIGAIAKAPTRPPHKRCCAGTCSKTDR